MPPLTGHILFIRRFCYKQIQTMSNKGNSVTKKINETVSRFRYYREAIVQDKSVQQTREPHSPKLYHASTALGPNQYHYFQQNRQPLHNQQPLEQGLLLAVAKQTLLDSHATKLNDNSFLKTHSSLPSLTHIKHSQVVEFALVDENQSAKTHHSNNKTTARPYSEDPQAKQKRYSLYIVHYPSESPFSWTYFVQRLLFTEKPHSKQQKNLASVEYQSVLTFPKEKQSFPFFKWLTPSKTLQFITQFIKSRQVKISLFESVLTKSLHDASLRNMAEQKNSHPQFKRQTRLPPSEFKKYQSLKKEVYSYFSQINKTRKANPYFLDNLVCRFLKFKNYDETDSSKAIKHYLDWEKHMRQTYTYESFNQYHCKDIYTYIGKDLEGHPILFYRPDHVLTAEVTQLDHFVDYNLYMMDIHMQDQMEGYVDGFILLADYEHFGSDNFKFHIAKSVADASDMFPERQHKLIAFNLGGFCHFVYRIIKPIIPKYALDKIHIFGLSDKDTFREFALTFMDTALLPKYIFPEHAIDTKSTSEIVTRNTLPLDDTPRKVARKLW